MGMTTCGVRAYSTRTSALSRVASCLSGVRLSNGTRFIISACDRARLHGGGNCLITRGAATIFFPCATNTQNCESRRSPCHSRRKWGFGQGPCLVVGEPGPALEARLELLELARHHVVADVGDEGDASEGEVPPCPPRLDEDQVDPLLLQPQAHLHRQGPILPQPQHHRAPQHLQSPHRPVSDAEGERACARSSTHDT